MRTDAIVCIGDCRTNVAKLKTASVQCVVTSPPYHLQRSYGKDSAEMGRETTVSEYVSQLVSLFEVMKPKLKDIGSLWVNIGDTYANPIAAGATHGKGVGRSNQQIFCARAQPVGFQPKSLMGVPARFQIAMQDAGWMLRQDIIWSKPAPRPESVTDRFTRSHEYLFHFVKCGAYYFDIEAAKEPGVTQDERRKRSVWTIGTERGSNHVAPYPVELVTPCILTTSRPGDTVIDPFHGSGTTGKVAQDHGRNYLGFELYGEFQSMWEARLKDVVVVKDFKWE